MTGFITVKEALQKCDREKLYQEVIKTYGFSENPEECAKETLLYVDKTSLLKPVKKDEFNVLVLFHQYEYDETEKQIKDSFDSTLLTLDEDSKWKPVAIKKEWTDFANADVDSFAFEEIDQCLDKLYEVPFPSRYAYEFVQTEVILGYYIPMSMIRKYGLEMNLAHILFEMTFFGFGPEENDETKKANMENLKASYEEIDVLTDIPGAEETQMVTSDPEEKTVETSAPLSKEEKLSIIKNHSEKIKDFVRDLMKEKKLRKQATLKGVLDFYEVLNSVIEDYQQK